MINVESSLVKGVVLILAVVLLLLVFIVSVPEGETVVLESVLSAVSELELLHGTFSKAYSVFNGQMIASVEKTCTHNKYSKITYILDR